MPKLDHVITITIIEILGSQEIYISVTRAFNSMSMTRLTSSVMHSQLYTILTFWLVDYLENQVRNIQLFIICNATVYSWLLIGNTYLRMGNLEGDVVMGKKCISCFGWEICKMSSFFPLLDVFCLFWVKLFINLFIF